MEPGVIETCEKALGAFRAFGMSVDAATLAEPADTMWRTAVTLRHWSVGADLLPHADKPDQRAMMKPEAIWEVEGYRKLSAREITEAQMGRSRIYEAFRKAFEIFDFLILPSAQVFPFDADLHWPTQVAGRTMDTYHRWMEVTFPVTMAGLPALSVPAGFGGAHKLPIGMQIIGPTHADLAVLQVGHAYERASPWIGQAMPAALRA
jgi:amidase